MRCGIYTNLKKDSELGFTLKLIGYLQKKGVECYVHYTISDFLRGFHSFNKVSKKFDFIITVGGDGTILRIAKQCAVAGVPILGFNLGTVGFLTEGERDSYETVVDEVLAGNYKIEQRILLSAHFGSKNRLALNDVVVSRENDNKLMLLHVYVGTQLIDKHYCDGFIVSTPTGSTAYSLSAGGAILSPTAKAIELTPINSHSLHSRPIVIGENEPVKILLTKPGSKAKIITDGHVIGSISNGESIEINMADCKASFIRLNKSNFYNKLLLKLNKWSVVNVDKENN